MEQHVHQVELRYTGRHRAALEGPLQRAALKHYVGIGRTGDASALGEIVLAYIAEDAPSGCVSAGLTSSIELSEVYVPEGRVDDVMVISRRLRDMARVSYTMGDGSVVYG